MASKAIEFHAEAEAAEYLAALVWYRERSPTAAISFESAFDRAISKIREAPHRWPIYTCRLPTIHAPPISVRHCVLYNVLSHFRSGDRSRPPASGILEKPH